jgi:hypothetical protein
MKLLLCSGVALAVLVAVVTIDSLRPSRHPAALSAEDAFDVGMKWGGMYAAETGELPNGAVRAIAWKRIHEPEYKAMWRDMKEEAASRNEMQGWTCHPSRWDVLTCEITNEGPREGIMWAVRSADTNWDAMMQPN